MIRFLLILYLFTPSIYTQDDQDDNAQPPSVDVSYKAIGEVTQALGSPFPKIDQVAFEEHYKASTADASYTIWEMGGNTTFLEFGKTDQVLMIEDGELCTVMKAEKLYETIPDLLPYKKGDKAHFSLRMLFDLDPTKIKADLSGKNTTYRNVPAIMWVYEFILSKTDTTETALNVYAYWSDSTFDTTSRERQVPLGYEIVKLVRDGGKITTTQQYVNVFAFLHDVEDEKAFRPTEGVYCDGRTHPYGFPRFSRLNALSFRSENVLQDDLEIRTMDVYYDTTNGMLRVDLDRLSGQAKDEKQQRYTSQITSQQLGAGFQVDVLKGVFSCTPYAIDKYPIDEQELIDPKIPKNKWGLDHIIGINTTNYVYIGKTTKRSIPCHVFQGVRNDFPDKNSGSTSLWEWCVTAKLDDDDIEVNFRDKELGLISATYQALTSAKVPKEPKIIHNFYDVLSEDPAALDLQYFDISSCFKTNEISYLQFMVDLKMDDFNKYVIENATSDIAFLRLWKIALCDKAKLPIHTMRIAKVKSTVFGNELFVSFYLLSVHDGLPEDIKATLTTSEVAYNNLKRSVDAGELKINYIPSKKAKPMPLTAVIGSLNFVVDEELDFQTTTTGVPVTVRTTLRPTIPVFTLATVDVPDDDGLGTKTVFEGHTKSTVATVSIALFLIGITAGAGGTFLFSKGRPRCC